MAMVAFVTDYVIPAQLAAALGPAYTARRVRRDVVDVRSEEEWSAALVGAKIPARKTNYTRGGFLRWSSEEAAAIVRALGKEPPKEWSR